MSDLLKERQTASFSSRQMTYFLFGEETTKKIEHIRKNFIENDPIFQQWKKDRYFLSHDELYLRSLDRWKRVIEKKSLFSKDDFELFQRLISEDGLEPTLSAIHDGLFLFTLKQQMTDEQLEKWLPLAENYQLFGCYAQTELGHGSNVRGLETTATFLPESDEFEINSPAVSSTKWWIGALGKTATHACVFARLLLHGRDYGIHPFLVQLRSLDTFLPLPGVVVGHIGPKFGFNEMDNGFLRLTKVRIPRTQLLMRNAAVDRSGRYLPSSTSPLAQRLTYLTMVRLRMVVISCSFSALARGTTIAVRYSATRRQFPQPSSASSSSSSSSSQEERQVLDYRLQQERLFPLVAQAYALLLVANHMNDFFDSCLQQLDRQGRQGETSQLHHLETTVAELHALASGLKSLSTRLASDGVEDCRRSCGGHGYSLFSGLPLVYTTTVHLNTAEGDNHLLTQQTAKYVLKALQAAALNQPLPQNCAHLSSSSPSPSSSSSVKSTKDFRTEEVQIEALQHLAKSVAQNCAEKLLHGDFAVTWNSLLPQLVLLSDSHCFLFISRIFCSTLEKAKKTSAEVYPVLARLRDLFVLSYLNSNFGHLLYDNYFSPRQVDLLRETIGELIVELRPDIVAIVDSFNFSDFNLNSAIATGEPYSTLFEWAQREPLNSTVVQLPLQRAKL